jgi:hypothetical protein
MPVISVRVGNKVDSLKRRTSETGWLLMRKKRIDRDQGTVPGLARPIALHGNRIDVREHEAEGGMTASLVAIAVAMTTAVRTGIAQYAGTGEKHKETRAWSRGADGCALLTNHES